jgi:hypothetical protein
MGAEPVRLLVDLLFDPSRSQDALVVRGTWVGSGLDTGSRATIDSKG